MNHIVHDDFDALLIPDDFGDLLHDATTSQSPLATARRYIASGWSPVPIPYRKKGPILEQWGRLRLNDESAANHFNGKQQNIGVILGEASGGLVDIDHDCREARLLAPTFLPSTDAIFGRESNPASHWLYRSPGMITKQVKFPGTRKTLLELRSNSQTDQPCQTVFPGSVHDGGETIRWSSAGEPAAVDANQLQKAFDRLSAATIIARAFPEQGSGRHDATLALIGLLTRAGWSEDLVIEFARAVRSAAGADPKKPLRKMVSDAAKRLAADKSLFGLPTLIEAFGEKVASSFCELIGYESISRAEPAAMAETSPDEFDDLEAGDPITAALNRKHAVVMPKGRTYVATFQPDGSIGLGTPRDIHAFYVNYRVPTPGGKSTEAASRRWMRDPERRTYPGGVTFAPAGCPADTLNLWSGWAVQPDATASCSLFLDHVYRVVCSGNREHADWVIGWFAHMVQRPEEKPGVALVLRGAKGAGKDTVAEYFAHLPGRRHVSTVAEPEHITGRFNARLENTLLLHVQEGAWAGDRKSEGTLKYLITSDHIEIERKGIDGVNMPSVLRLFISANAEWVVPASADERRWAVFEVSDKRRGDEAYFKALRAEMDSGGPSALLHYLRNCDLSGFNVRKAPETEGLRNQKLASLRSVELWWFEILSRGTFPCSLDDGDGWASSVQTIARDSLRRDYVDWMKGRRYDGEVVEERYFGRRLRNMLSTINDRRPSAKPGVTRIRQYEVPALAECRAAFDQWMGQPVDWEPVEG